MTDQTQHIAPIEALKDAGPIAPPRNKWLDVWTQFTKHKGALIGFFFLIFITATVVFGPMLWNVEPGKIDIRNKNIRPIYAAIWDSDANVSWAKPLGSDNLGKDHLAQLLQGGRTSMAVGWAAMALTLLIGTSIGVMAGYFKKMDGVLMRITDLFLALPGLPLLLVAVTLFREPLRGAFGPEGGMFILIVSVTAVTSWMPTARIVRGDVLALKEREFVVAAQSIGTKPGKLIMRHILPNVLSPILVSAALGLATAIITESALSFLGVGFPPDYPTWGKMLADAVIRMEQYPERVMLPGLAISLTVLAVNYMGDGIRDALDPRIRGR